jgi:hypothetical protein
VTGARRRSADQDPLALLGVIRRLEVGPVRLERRRLVAPYTVTKGRASASTELVYTYEEPVFEPGDPGSQNLAHVIAAQVALNYGLFCDEIVFHGPYDPIDQRFIADNARHTAREIYVKKFLEPNPYLRGAATRLPVVRRKDYLRARLSFPDAVAGRRGEPPAAGFISSPEGHAVLSSGGKDSLLTYGLLRRLGLAAHPIYINESGRHWFTALNAYRHFADKVEHTARVWTNSDRVFAWMLGHLPFVRRDFATVRSDEYPIRLWTVAVFLFGALPLMRKRGIGRLLIGNENDTTRQGRFQGIPHADGLYDQSRPFDEALTRYFQRKGWSLLQLSILRPMSELLIQRTLALHYPDLLRLQTSCHAAHREQGGIRPCGRCEKCRRIVAMLVALGADPSACGYGPEDVARCLASLPATGIHQEPAGVAQIGYLLRERGRLAADAIGGVKARPRPEVLKLRFDPDRAPLQAVPRDLRQPLLNVMAEHADGVVRRVGHRWVETDLLRDLERL